jgi:hypothetical protein
MEYRTNKIILLFTVVISLLVLFPSCHTLKVTKPEENYLSSNYLPDYSIITVPVETSPKEIEKVINKRFSGKIYSDESFDDNDNDNLMMNAWTTDSIRIQFDMNSILYRVPLKVWIMKKIGVSVLGVDLGTVKEVNAEIVLNFRTRISVSKDWTLSTLTTIEGYEWVVQPKIEVSGVKIPMLFTADLLVNANKETLCKQIDKAFRENIDLKTMMREAWTELQKPVLLSPENSLWLKITPVDISTTPFVGEKAFINHPVGIRSLIELTLGNEPRYTVNSQLPPLQLTSRLTDQFNINFSVNVPFTMINEMAEKQLAGYEFKYGKYRIRIKDIYLYGSGEKLVAAIGTEGSIQGTIYLAGEPEFDKSSLSLKVVNLDFDLNTKNALIRSATWIFHSGLIQMMSSKLTYPVGDQLTEARTRMQSYLDNNQTIGLFRLIGNIDEFSIGKIAILPDAVMAYFLFEGKLKASLIGD